jgi:hypothetical protein
MSERIVFTVTCEHPYIKHKAGKIAAEIQDHMRAYWFRDAKVSIEDIKSASTGPSAEASARAEFGDPSPAPHDDAKKTIPPVCSATCPICDGKGIVEDISAPNQAANYPVIPDSCLCRKVYISSSWKNRDRVREVAMSLRKHGHEVYDFTDPSCRKTPEIPPERFPDPFDPERGSYAQYISSVPEWRHAVECNQEAIRWCDAVVLLLPCGADAHADWAYAIGLGKRTCVVGSPKMGERTPTHLWADALLDTDDGIPQWVSRVSIADPCPLEAENAKLRADIEARQRGTAEVVNEVHRMKADLDAIAIALPGTFYAGLPLAQRVQQMSAGWYRAVAANHYLESENSTLREKSDVLIMERDKASHRAEKAEKDLANALEVLNSVSTHYPRTCDLDRADALLLKHREVKNAE